MLRGAALLGLLAAAAAVPMNCTTPFAQECTLPIGVSMVVNGSNVVTVSQNTYAYFLFQVSAGVCALPASCSPRACRFRIW
jgi:hypothetical protein